MPGLSGHAVPRPVIRPEETGVRGSVQPLFEPLPEAREHATCGKLRHAERRRNAGGECRRIHDIEIAAPMMPGGSRKRGPTQDGQNAGLGRKAACVEFPFIRIEQGTLATRLGVPDQ